MLLEQMLKIDGELANGVVVGRLARPRTARLQRPDAQPAKVETVHGQAVRHRQ